MTESKKTIKELGKIIKDASEELLTEVIEAADVERYMKLSKRKYDKEILSQMGDVLFKKLSNLERKDRNKKDMVNVMRAYCLAEEGYHRIREVARFFREDYFELGRGYPGKYFFEARDLVMNYEGKDEERVWELYDLVLPGGYIRPATEEELKIRASRSTSLGI